MLTVRVQRKNNYGLHRAKFNLCNILPRNFLFSFHFLFLVFIRSIEKYSIFVTSALVRLIIFNNTKNF